MRYGISQKVAILSMALVTFTAVTISAAFYFFLRDISRERKLTNLQNLTALFESEFQGDVQEIVRDLAVLVELPIVKTFIDLKPTSTEWRQAENDVANIFAVHLKYWPNYTQIRVIGTADGGREILRYSRNDEAVARTSEADLQAKGQSTYFKETIKLKKGQIYLSEINLNKEHDEVQVPHVATLRFSTPLFRSTGDLYGIIVINVAINKFFTKLQASTSEGQIIIASDTGDYLFHPRKEWEFGFDLGHRHRLQDDFPVLGSSLLEDTQIRQLVEFEKESSFLQMRQVNYGSPESKRKLWLGLVVNESSLSAIWSTLQQQTLPISIGLTLLSLTLGFFLSGYVTKPLVQLRQAMARMIENPDDAQPVLLSSSRDETGELVRTFLSLRKEIRERTAQVTESEERYRSIIETAVDAIITIDEMGTMASVNPAASRLFGYDPKELIGQNVKILMPSPYQEEHDGYLAHFRESAEERIIGRGRRLSGLRKDGRQVPIHLSVGMMTIGGKRMFTGITRDITEIKEFEDSLNLRTKQLERSNSELQHFAYAAAHDLQEPLRKIINFSEMLGEECQHELPPEGKRYLEILRSSAKRMRNQIEALLALSQVGKQAGDAHSNCRVLLQQVLDALQLQIADKNAKIVIGDLPDSVPIHPTEFERLLQNLISNALKFTPTDRIPEVHIAGYLDQGEWHMVVRDNGIGIESKYKDLIFVVFQRLHRREQYPGNGIGLALCRKIVENYGGRIWVDSKPGEGSAFNFTIPVIPMDKRAT